MMLIRKIFLCCAMLVCGFSAPALMAQTAAAPDEQPAPVTAGYKDAVDIEEDEPTENAAAEIPLDGQEAQPAAEEEIEDPGWDVTWRDYMGKVTIFTKEELPRKMEEANDKRKKRGKKKEDSETAFILGYMYQYGEGVEQPDDMVAQKWYNTAAKAGNIRAMNALGEFYMGYGDGGLAAKWFKKAAEQDNAYANYKLGEIYEYGFQQIYQSPEKAFSYYSLAAEGGIENAYLKLGQFYQYGFGVPLDVNKAITYYRKLLKTKNKTRKQQVEFLLSEVFAMIAEQKTGEDRLKWLVKSAQKGNLRSIIRLADIYAAEDADVPQNMPEAIKWYKVASDMGDVYSMVRLGYIYNNGTLEMDPDSCLAYDYFFKAAEKKNKDAMYNLGNFYTNGYCDKYPVDYDKANEWYRRSQ